MLWTCLDMAGRPRWVHQAGPDPGGDSASDRAVGGAAPDPVVALWKDGPAERIELGVLERHNDRGAAGQGAGGAGGCGVGTAAGRSQRRQSDGVAGAGERDAGQRGAGRRWRPLASSWRCAADGPVVELAAQRLRDLSAAERTVLELVTVGEPLGEGELAQLADPPAVEDLERKGFITSRLVGRRLQVWLAHPVYGDVVRAGISALRERGIAGSLADVIEAVGGRRREDTLRLASLHLAGGGGSAGLMAAGALAARSRHDHSLAERLARAAIAEGAGFNARFVAAEAAHFQGRRPRPNVSWLPWPWTRSAMPSGPASPCSASTTPTSFRVRKLACS